MNILLHATPNEFFTKLRPTLKPTIGDGNDAVRVANLGLKYTPGFSHVPKSFGVRVDTSYVVHVSSWRDD